MTQNKKKGIAKKALSVSLVAAMLATSNVPAWASGFEAVDPAEGFAVEAAAPETEAVDAAEDTAASAAYVENDVTADFTVNNAKSTSVLWGQGVAVKGTIKINETGNDLDTWGFVWQKSDGTAIKTGTANKDTATTAMSLSETEVSYELAGETLSLYVYRNDEAGAVFNINTGITVNVEKRELSTIKVNGISFEYTGFPQKLEATDEDKIEIKDELGAIVTDDWYDVTYTTATNAGDKVTITVDAKENGPYINALSADVKIDKKDYEPGDIIASVDKGLTYQYTGETIQVPVANVHLNESQSEDGGETDKRLNGANVSDAIVKAESKSTEVGTSPVTVTVDNSKLKNINANDGKGTGTIDTTETITITKRNLTNNTTLSWKYGAMAPGSSRQDIYDNLIFSDGNTSISLTPDVDYIMTVENAAGTIITGSIPETGDYKVTITATEDGHAIGSQSIDLPVYGNVVTGATYSKEVTYAPEYTGSAIEPTQSDLGDLTIEGTAGNDKLEAGDWKIVGYSNNVNAYDAETNPTHAWVKIEILDSTYAGQTVNVAFDIEKLAIKEASAPKTISYNKTFTDAEEYQVPVTVIAEDSKKSYEITLDESDYKVTYAYKTTADGNKVGNEITSTVTILNDNFTKNDVTSVAANDTEIVAKALTDAMIQVNPSSYTYTGGKITPEFEVIDGSIVLYKDTEYTASVTDNVNVGTGKITVTGKAVGNEGYSGTATATFEITPANTSAVKVDIDDKEYTGKQVRPRMSEIEVTLNGNDVSSQFEVVSYGENVEAGTGTVVLTTVDGNKNFTGGDITVEFNIVQDQVKGDLHVYNEYGQDITASVENKTTTFEFDGTAKTFEKALLQNIVTDEGDSVDADNFEILYVDNVTGKYSADGKNIACVYAVAKDGSGYAGKETITAADGTKIKGVVDYIEFVITSVEFVEKNVTVNNGVYAGGLPVEPEVLVQIGGNTLVEGVDYELEFDSIYTEVTAGKTLNVTVKGLGGYAGSEVPNIKWGIDKKDLADCDVTLENGVLTVMNGLVLVPSDEYTTTDNGNGSVTVKAAATSRNYIGSVTVYESVPETPDATTLTVTDRTTSTVSLSWDKVDGAEGYTIWFRSEYDTEMSRKIIFDGDQTTWTQTGLQPGTKYFYAMRSWVKDDEGNYIFSDVSPTQRGTTKPIAARIASVSVSNGKIKVNLAGEAAGAEMYSMCYGDSRTCFAANDFKVGIRTQYTTRTLTPTFEPGTYYVCVKSYRDLGNGKRVYGAWSNTFRAVVK